MEKRNFELAKELYIAVKADARSKIKEWEFLATDVQIKKLKKYNKEFLQKLADIKEQTNCNYDGASIGLYGLASIISNRINKITNPPPKIDDWDEDDWSEGETKSKYSKEEQVWFGIKANCYDYLPLGAGVEEKNANTPEGKRKILGHAEWMDKEFEKEAGMSMEEFLKKHPTFWSFAIKADDKYKGKKQGGAYINKKLKKSEALFYKGVTTDRALNLMVAKADLHIDGPFNHRTKWIHDVFCQKMWDYILEGMVPEEINKKQGLLNKPPKSLEEVNALIEELRADLPAILFTDKEFRDITGLKKLSGEEIRKLVKDYNKLSLNGFVQLYHDPETGHYKELLFDNFPIGGVLIQKSGRYSSQNKKPEYKYLMVFNFYNLIVFHNLMAVSFTKFPQEFYKLKRAGQEIYRKIAQHRGSKFNIVTLARYIGYSEYTVKSNIWQIEKWVDVALDELKEEKFIIGWKGEGSGKRRVYTIKRI